MATCDAVAGIDHRLLCQRFVISQCQLVLLVYSPNEKGYQILASPAPFPSPQSIVSFYILCLLFLTIHNLLDDRIPHPIIDSFGLPKQFSEMSNLGREFRYTMSRGDRFHARCRDITTGLTS